MRAECDVLPSANGSARIALEDGTEALVGVKAEVEKSGWVNAVFSRGDGGRGIEDVDMMGEEEDWGKGKGRNEWVELTVDIPGFRDDDALPVFLASMLLETVLGSGGLKDRLYINTRFHWKLYIDVRKTPSLPPSSIPHNKSLKFWLIDWCIME